MCKVLIVDDERDYRDQLSLCLSEDELEIRTAGSGREAIDLGACFRPDVLVADWMLKNHIHGLHVAEVLQREPGVAQPFESVRGAVAMSLRQKTYVTALRQYLRLLAEQASIEGVELEAADKPLLQ